MKLIRSLLTTVVTILAINHKQTSQALWLPIGNSLIVNALEYASKQTITTQGRSICVTWQQDDERR